jgi:hypothetical protein
MRKLQRGDKVLIKATVYGVFTEDETVGPDDGYYLLHLPEGLEYRFPEAGVPTAIIHRKDLKRQKP